MTNGITLIFFYTLQINATKYKLKKATLNYDPLCPSFPSISKIIFSNKNLLFCVFTFVKNHNDSLCPMIHCVLVSPETSYYFIQVTMHQLMSIWNWIKLLETLISTLCLKTNPLMYVLVKNGIDSLVVSSYLIKSKFSLIVEI